MLIDSHSHNPLVTLLVFVASLEVQIKNRGWRRTPFVKFFFPQSITSYCLLQSITIGDIISKEELRRERFYLGTSLMSMCPNLPIKLKQFLLTWFHQILSETINSDILLSG